MLDSSSTCPPRPAQGRLSRDALAAHVRDLIAGPLVSDRLSRHLAGLDQPLFSLVLALVDVARGEMAELDAFRRVMAEHEVETTAELTIALADARREG